MTPEIISQLPASSDVSVSVTQIYAVIATSVGFCGTLLKILFDRSKKCEEWRDEKEPLINRMAQALGIAEGVAGMVNRCDVPTCPHRGKINPTFSIEEIKSNTKTKL